MGKTLVAAVAAVAMVGCGGGMADTEGEQLLLDEAAITGNGAPSGAHFNLNIIGMKEPKAVTNDNSNGGRIFVPLYGKCSIQLREGESFDVLDYNGTDGIARFQLPNPDPDNDGITRYSVWARATGKPGGSSTTTTCAYDTEGYLWCSETSMVLVRDSSKFANVTAQLLYIYADLNADGKAERYPLFSDALQDYFWSYDNNGLKNAQLRFYEIPTTVPATL